MHDKLTLRGRWAALKLKVHETTHKWTHGFEHACAGAYAVHEVFHFSAPVVWTAYGLIGFAALSFITTFLVKGGS